MKNDSDFDAQKNTGSIGGKAWGGDEVNNSTLLRTQGGGAAPHGRRLPPDRSVGALRGGHTHGVPESNSTQIPNCR